MITPAFGLTATERVLPKLALDFTTASLDSRITFTRTGNTATYTNSSGYIQTVNADIPRFDYDPITLVCKGLLIEESRINIFIYSNTFSDASWTKSNCTITPNAINSPDGTTNASKLIPNTVSTQHRMFLSSRGVAGAHTVSAYMKQGEYTWGVIRTEGINTFFNLTNGTLGTVGVGITASITPAANGFYRCVVTKTLLAATISTVGAGSADGVDAFVGDDIKGIYVYGAQMEAGAFATSYIPTTTTALTRNADVATMTGTNFSDWYNASEGAFAASGYFRDASAVGTAGLPLFTATDGVSASSNIFELRRQNNSGNPYIRMMTYSGGNAETSSSLGFTTGQPVFAAMGYIVNNVSGAINGNTNVTDTVAVMPVGIDRLQLGSSFNQYMNGWLQSLRFWPQRLTNNEIRAFSK